jgi:hypothetical protein
MPATQITGKQTKFPRIPLTKEKGIIYGYSTKKKLFFQEVFPQEGQTTSFYPKESS